MKLCIAEKPSVAGEIAKIIGASSRKDGYYEGNGYQVTWTFGHLCTLNEPGDYNESFRKWNILSLPILPKEFKIKLIENKGVGEQFEKIKSLVKEAEEVINCGDAGQEGELIQRWVLEHAECNVPIKRLWISSLTEEAIKEGFDKLMKSEDFDTLFEAGKSRAISDWLYGINATRLFTLKFGKNKQVLSVGRVQTPTLAMIVKRHFEIKNFVPQLYFELKTKYKGASFSYTKGKIEQKQSGEKLIEAIKDLPLTIDKVKIKEGKENPPNLFDLTSLQVEANNKFGLSAEQTLTNLQSLYEKKLVTYPRVDTVFLPNDQYPKIKGIMKGLFNYQDLVAPLMDKPIKKSKKVFNDNKVTDHHAIIPTGVQATAIAGAEASIYDLIAKRFIAAFYPECKVSNTTIEASVEKHKFKATGKQILDQGWRVVYAKDSAKKEEKGVLPLFDEGESGPHEPYLDSKKTSAPKPYTEATLLRAMETAGKNVDNEELKQLMKENGIGRPSTRANIIETLFRRKYIEKKKKNILPTETGINLIKLIENPTLRSAELTGQWEKKLRDIESGEYQSSSFINEMGQLVESLVLDVVTRKQGSKLECPKCEVGKIVKGKTAYGCTEWKNGCSFTIPFDVDGEQVNDQTVGRLVHHKKVLLLNHEKGTKTLMINPEFKIVIQKDKHLDIVCPKCGTGKIKKGKSAWGCSEYQKTCDFLVPFKFVEETTRNLDFEKFLVNKVIQTSDKIVKLTEDFGLEIE